MSGSYYASGVYRTDGTAIGGDDIYSSAEVDALIAALDGLASEDIDTLAEINAILTDANLASISYVDGLASNYATASQGIAADSALQPSDITSGAITPGTGDIDFDALGGGGGVSGSTGGSDNRVLRSDGGGGGTLQSSAVTIDDNGALAVPSGQRLYLDGGTDTYMVEESANRLAIYTAGMKRTEITGGAWRTSAGYWYAPGIAALTDTNTGVYWPANDTFGVVTGSVERWRISFAGEVVTVPSRVGLYTFATVPTASSYTGHQITISDRSYRSAYSDGTNWRFISDDAIIS